MVLVLVLARQSVCCQDQQAEMFQHNLKPKRTQKLRDSWKEVQNTQEAGRKERLKMTGKGRHALTT